MEKTVSQLLSETHPYDELPEALREDLAAQIATLEFGADQGIYEFGQKLRALYLICSGKVTVADESGEMISVLGPGNSFGERGLLREGVAVTTATAAEDTTLLAIPAATFVQLVANHPVVGEFFDRARPARAKQRDLNALTLQDVMTLRPVTCSPELTVQDAARLMRDRTISSLIISEKEKITGIVTTHDLSNKALAEGLPLATPISKVMTGSPLTLPPTALVSDALHAMIEKRITHLPVAKSGKLLGILTQTDLTRFQAVSSSAMIYDIAHAQDIETLTEIVHRIPLLLAQLVGGHHPHQVVTRLITDIGDATTRRLLAMAEAKFGPAPVPYLWLACGSQGRQEQTGVSDQDNCLIIDDRMTPEDDAYFKALAKFVSDGLDACGYFYCPGDMMATADRWRKPLRVWREYFAKWIASPDNEAQMLASVMFDLRPIGGTFALFEALQNETLDMAAENSIFVAHMVSNSLKHHPPLGLFGGLATTRSGEHKNTIDLKHNGVVPVVDLGRIYALQGRHRVANTRDRLLAAINGGQVSGSGGHDLLHAYDMIAEARLEHQAAQIRRGDKPDNFMPPSDLSDFERSHLRDAFVVVKTMQSAAGSGRGILT